MAWSNSHNKLRLLFAVCAAAVVFVAKQQYDGMDPVLVQPYLMEDRHGAQE